MHPAPEKHRTIIKRVLKMTKPKQREKKPRSEEPKPYKANWFETLLIALAIVLILRATVIQAFNIPSGSMEDTLLIGDFLLGEKITFRFRSPRRGEIVIFEHPKIPGRDLIKRCVAIEGDTVLVVNKQLFINGKKASDPPESKHQDPRIIPARYAPRDNFGPYIIPKEHIFLMGDNRDNSEDSRFWKALPLKNVKARPLFLYLSVDPGPNPPKVTSTIDIYKSLLRSVFRFPPRIRVMRTGMIVR